MEKLRLRRGGRQTSQAAGQSPECAVRNALEINCFGLRRSGNHGVIAWIAQQYERPIVFLNNVRPFQDPFATFMLGKVPNTVPGRKISPERVETLRRQRKPLLLVSYEDVGLRRIANRDTIPSRREQVGESGTFKRLLLLRDFYNWLASRVRLFEIRGGEAELPLALVERQIQLWLVYAREFVGETAYLGEALTTVAFTRWLENEDYRLEILNRLDIPILNNSRTIVPKTGGGSSFDGTAFSGDADSMELLRRWKYLAEPRYQPIVRLLETQRELVDRYNQEIFGLQYPFGS